jgi:hypothetical protein
MGHPEFNKVVLAIHLIVENKMLKIISIADDEVEAQT